MRFNVGLVVIVLILKASYGFEFARKNFDQDGKENMKNKNTIMTNKTDTLHAEIKKDAKIHNITLKNTNVTTIHNSPNDLFQIVDDNIQKGSQINHNGQIVENESNNDLKLDKFSYIVASNLTNIVDSEHSNQMNDSKKWFYQPNQPNMDESSTKYTLMEILTKSQAKTKPLFERVKTQDHKVDLDNKTSVRIQNVIKNIYPSLEQKQLSEIIDFLTYKNISVFTKNEKSNLPINLVSDTNVSSIYPEMLSVNSNVKIEITKPDNQILLHLYSFKAISVPISNTENASEIITSKQSDASHRNILKTNSFDLKAATQLLSSLPKTSGKDIGLFKNLFKHPENNFTIYNSTHLIWYNIDNDESNSTIIPISEALNNNVSTLHNIPQLLVFDKSKENSQKKQQWYMNGNPLDKLLTLTSDLNPPPRIRNSGLRGNMPFSDISEINVASKYSVKDNNNNNDANTNVQNSGLFSNIIEFPENNFTILNSTHLIWSKIDNNESNSIIIPMDETLNKNISALRKIPQLTVFEPSKSPKDSQENRHNVQWYMTGNPFYKLLTVTNDLNPPLRVGYIRWRDNTPFSVINERNTTPKSSTKDYNVVNLQEIPSKIYERGHMYSSPQVIIPQNVESLKIKPGQEDNDKLKGIVFEAFKQSSLQASKEGTLQPIAIATPWATKNAIFTSSVREQPNIKDEPQENTVQNINFVPKVTSQIPFPQHQIKTELSPMEPYYTSYSMKNPLVPMLQPESEKPVNTEHNVRQTFETHEPVMMNTINNVTVTPFEHPSIKIGIKSNEKTQVVEPIIKVFAENQKLQAVPISNIKYAELKAQADSKPYNTFQFKQMAHELILPKSKLNTRLSPVKQDILTKESISSQNVPQIKLNLIKFIETNKATPNTSQANSIDHSQLKYMYLNNTNGSFISNSGAKLLLSNLKNQDECGDRTFWTRNCHYCVCNQGKAICDKISDCILRPFGLPMLCKPYSKFMMDDCYLCECNADGVPECKAVCEDRSDNGVNTPLPSYNDYKQQFEEIDGYYNSYEPNCNKNNPTCESGTTWVSNCHQCLCDNGEHECNKILDCVLDKKTYGNPGRCKPNSNFNPRPNSMGCVSCSCDDEGTPHCKQSIVLNGKQFYKD